MVNGRAVPARAAAASPTVETPAGALLGGIGDSTGETAVDSPYDQSHRKDSQVVEAREEALAALTPQTAYDLLDWPCI